MFQASYLLQCQAEEPLFLVALVIYPSILSHGIYTSLFSSTSLNSPSCLFISCFSFLPSSPSIGLGLLGLLSGRFGGGRMQSSRKHQLYQQKCGVCREKDKQDYPDGKGNFQPSHTTHRRCLEVKRVPSSVRQGHRSLRKGSN